jgi:hypothetical protein
MTYRFTGTEILSSSKDLPWYEEEWRLDGHMDRWQRVRRRRRLVSWSNWLLDAVYEIDSITLAFADDESDVHSVDALAIRIV